MRSPYRQLIELPEGRFQTFLDISLNWIIFFFFGQEWERLLYVFIILLFIDSLYRIIQAWISTSFVDTVIPGITLKFIKTPSTIDIIGRNFNLSNYWIKARVSFFRTYYQSWTISFQIKKNSNFLLCNLKLGFKKFESSFSFATDWCLNLNTK